MSEQVELLPKKPPRWEMRRVRLADLPPDEDMPSDPPDASLVESIKVLGILQPPGVMIDGEHDCYRVAFGRRRIKAARQAELTQIDVRVFEYGAPIEIMTIVENELRRRNPASDYLAIMRLLQSNEMVSEAMIAAAVGVSIGTVRARLRLNALQPELLQAFLSGAVSTTLAEKIARQPVGIQKRLVAVYEAEGKLTPKDVKHAREVVRTAVSKQLGQLLDTGAAVSSAPKVNVQVRYAADLDGAPAASMAQAVGMHVTVYVDDVAHSGVVPLSELAGMLLKSGRLSKQEAERPARRKKNEVIVDAVPA